MANLATISNNILADSGIDSINVVTGSGTANQIAYWSSGTSIGSLTTATYPSLTELSYVKGVTSAIQTQLNAKQDSITLTTTGTSGAATLVGATLNIPQYQSVLTNPVTGTGTTNYVARWTSGSAIGTGVLYDDGTNVGIGTTSPGAKLQIAGNTIIDNTLYINNINGTAVVNAYSGGQTGTYLAKSSSATANFTTTGVSFPRGLGVGAIIGQANTTDIAVKNSSWNGGYGGLIGFWSDIDYGIEGGTNSIGYHTVIKGTGTSNSYGFFADLSGVTGGVRYGIYIKGEQYNYFSGNIGIGTATTTYKLDVNGTARVSGESTFNSSVTLSSTASAFVVLDNTTATTGKQWRASSAANGRFYVTNVTDALDVITLLSTGEATFSSSVTASSLIKSGGTSAQILAADGSVITAGTNITISGGTISSSGGGSASIGGTVTGGTTGSILFIDPTATLAQDNANFFWDNTNNRLGIGTSSPGYTLSVNGDAVLSPTGSSTTTPRVLGISGFAAGQAARWQFGDALNSIQNNHSGRFILQSYWGMSIYGGRINVTPLGFELGLTTDWSLNVLGTTAANPVFVVTGAASQSGNLQQWRNSAGTVLSSVTSSGQLQLLPAGSTTTGGGQLYLNGATSNRIDFGTVGVAAPAFTTRSAGTKITLFPNVSAASMDFALGIESGAMWFSTADATAGSQFKWYAGVTNVLSLTGAGVMTLSRNQNAVTYLQISNTTSGTSSQAQLYLTSDATTGSFSFGKRSAGVASTKIIVAKDGYIYNDTGGDIAILNDFASGAIKFAAGGSSVSQLVLKTTGQLQINNYTSTSAFTGTAVGYLGFDSSGNLLSSVTPWSVTFNRQVASYTLAASDVGKMVEMNVGTANNLTVPLNSTIPIAVGSQIDIVQYGAGQTTIVATGGVTIRSTGGLLKLYGQYAAATLIKVGTDEWYLFGDLAA